MRKKRKPKKKTKREYLMMSEGRRRRHEMRKARKQKDQSPVCITKDGDSEYSPNIEAMFRKKRKE